jgi:hypothetical protein
MAINNMVVEGISQNGWIAIEGANTALCTTVSIRTNCFGRCDAKVSVTEESTGKCSVFQITGIFKNATSGASLIDSRVSLLPLGDSSLALASAAFVANGNSLSAYVTGIEGLNLAFEVQLSADQVVKS